MTAQYELVANRFLVRDGMPTVDLATGDRVELVVSMGGGYSEQARWASRCGWFARLHHRRIARLVDFGALGQVHRFEAWRVDGCGEGSAGAATRASGDAERFLEVCGLTNGDLGASAVHAVNGRAVVLPAASAGYERAGGAVGVDREPLSLEGLGLTTIARPAVATLGELAAEAPGHRLGLFSLVSPRGAGLRTALVDLARGVRAQGIIPLSTRAMHPAVVPLLTARSVMLIVPSDPRHGWRMLTELCLHSVTPRFIVFCDRLEARDVFPIRLERVGVEALCNAVLPERRVQSQRRALVRIAVRAQGLPGRFAALLWGIRTDDAVRAERASRAAEPVAVYGRPSDDRQSIESPSTSQAWPSTSELAALRRRVQEGVMHVAAGRHAVGDRVLRQTAASLARRHDWPHAAEAAIALAESRLRRGRLKEAQAVLTDAQRAASCGALDAALVRVSVLSGVASTNELRLDVAERMLAAAAASARGLSEPEVLCDATLALARCLFWAGEYAAGEHALVALDGRKWTDAVAVHLAAERSRLAVGRGDLHCAISQAAFARARAEAASAPALVGVAAWARSFANLAAGDSRAADADAVSCVSAAHRSHDPWLALRARLLSAEARRRLGIRGPAGALTRRLLHMDGRRIPPIVRARVQLLADLLSAPDPAAVAARHARSTGLAALSLFAPAGPGTSDLAYKVRDVVEILRCCQTAEEDSNVLAAVCARLREKLQAAAVAFFVADRGVHVLVASDGGRIEPALAARTGDLDDLLVPHEGQSQLEGGVVVRYAGRRLGTLVVRWSTGISRDFQDASVLLTTAAAAAGPALAGVVARRAERSIGPQVHLLGASVGIGEVRRSVERAAVAPFAVLIEGESGSGKELVARALHRIGPRRDRPFCPLNCAALPDDLVESELFGHARGAFTGAATERVGVFEEAHGGTLFLDEIGELSPRAQAKLLRTIQDGELRRLGENTSRRVDVRLVAATNRNLAHEVAAGRFRADLLYRLDVIRIAVPPLRERRDDIGLLAEHFWREATARVGSRATLGTATFGALARYDWPGNVRELQNVLSALAVRSPRRGVVPPSALPPHFDGAATDRSWRLDDARRAFELHFVRAALARSGGHRARAAADLGLTRQGLTKLMTRLGLGDADEESSAASSDRA